MATQMRVVAETPAFDYWDFDKNKGLDPRTASASSKINVWWICALGHSWNQAIYAKVKAKSCPFCINQRVWPGFNDLATTHPALAKQWNQAKNGPVYPRDVIAGTRKSFWWTCDQGHEWLASLGSRTAGTGCPICSGRQVNPGANDVLTVRPLIVQEWNFGLNGDQHPESTNAGSNRPVWWTCSLGHDWQAPPKSRCYGKKTNCPFCANQKLLVGFNDFATRFPDYTKDWDLEKNNGLRPTDITYGSPRPIWITCSNGHSWKTTASSIKAGRSCPVCVNQKVLPGVNDLATTNPSLALEFHTTLNTFSPEEITAGSNKKIWWICNSSHFWAASPAQRSKLKGTGCPFCSNREVLPGFNDLANTRPDLLVLWDKEANGSLTPERVVAGTARRIHWVCSNGHKFTQTGDKVSRGIGCPVCSNYEVRRGVNDLATTHPELELEWDYQANKGVSPENVSAGSHRKIYWRCLEGHSWSASLANRAGGTGCPSCAKSGFRSDGQAILYFIENPDLKARKIGITSWNAKRLARFNGKGWKTIKTWEFDFGRDAKFVEKTIFNWIREVMGLGVALGAEDVGRMGGWTETFHFGRVSNNEVILEIENILDSHELSDW